MAAERLSAAARAVSWVWARLASGTSMASVTPGMTTAAYPVNLAGGVDGVFKPWPVGEAIRIQQRRLRLAQSAVERGVVGGGG